MSIELGRKLISKNGHEVYVIAEIGQNHQGNLDTAKKLILEAKKANVDCVKFQKSCMTAKFTKLALRRPYNNVNSFGLTYGAHKEFLEFQDIKYKELQTFCNEIGIDFTASAMDEVSLHFLDTLNVPFIKIGSGDANNFPLLEKAAQLTKTLIISTGMQTMYTIERIVEIMRTAQKTNFALLHCVSAYPTEPKDCTLQMISILMQKYPNIVIGYSGHELGTDITLSAVLVGARVVERHFTLDKSLKGSDHQCSLLTKELKQITTKIEFFKKQNLLNNSFSKAEILKILGNSKEVEQALQIVKEKQILESEMACKKKLGKTIIAAIGLTSGHKLTSTDLWIKVSEPNGIPAEDYYMILGAVLKRNIEQDQPIHIEDIE